MPQKIPQPDGTEIEVFTQDELNTKAQEVADQKVAEEREKLETEKQTALEEEQSKSAADREELEKLRKKDMNFEALRKSKTLTPEQEEEAKKNADDLKSLKDKVAEIEKQPLEALKNNFVATNIGANKELAEKFDFFYKKLSVGAKTTDEVNQAIAASFAAANEGKSQPNREASMTHTGVNDDFAGMGDATQESENSQEFGRMLGLTAKDKKDFGPVAKNGTVPLFANTSPIFKKNE